MYYVKRIRVTGMDDFLLTNWYEQLENLKSMLNVEVEICPQNRFFCATALATEGIMNGVDAVTATFSGFGRHCGFAAFEEVMMAVKTLMGCPLNVNLRVFQSIKEVFESISGYRISTTKPVIGTDIFKYESGIHASCEGLNASKILSKIRERCINLRRGLNDEELRELYGGRL